MSDRTIRIAVIGVGNCASSLIQGLTYYRHNPPVGVIHEVLDGYRVTDIEPVLAFDIDSRKVGTDLSQAVTRMAEAVVAIVVFAVMIDRRGRMKHAAETHTGLNNELLDRSGRSGVN